VVERHGAARRSASLPPPQRKDLHNDHDGVDEVGPRLRRLPLEDLSCRRATQPDTRCPWAGIQNELYATEDGDFLETELEMDIAFARETVDKGDLMLQRSELQKDEEPTRANLSPQRTLALNGLASQVMTADGVIKPLRQSPSAACFNNPANKASSCCTAAKALDTPARCNRNTTDKVDAFQSKFVHNHSEAAPATGAMCEIPSMDELVALKQKLGDALIKASMKPNHVQVSANKVRMFQCASDVELIDLKNKLRQALAFSKTGSMRQTFTNSTSRLPSSTFTTVEYNLNQCTPRTAPISHGGCMAVETLRKKGRWWCQR